MSLSGEILQTVSNEVTAWLPVTTPFTSITDCSSQIYFQSLGSRLQAFDPVFPRDIDQSAVSACLGPEASAWWLGATAPTTTLLGPTFVCPEAYSAVETILVNAQTNQVLCCPSQYSLVAPITSHGQFPTQCLSTAPLGHSITFWTNSNGGGSPYVTTATVTPIPVFAQHVNGFNVNSADASTIGSATSGSGSMTATTSSTSTSTTPSTSTSTTSSTSTPTSKTSSTAETKALSSGAVAGVGVGAAAGFFFLCLAALFLYHQWKRKRAGPMATLIPELYDGQHPPLIGHYNAGYPLAMKMHQLGPHMEHYEIGSSGYTRQGNGVHEMS